MITLTYLIIRIKNIAGNMTPNKKNTNGATYLSTHTGLFPCPSVNRRFFPIDNVTKRKAKKYSIF